MNRNIANKIQQNIYQKCIRVFLCICAKAASRWTTTKIWWGAEFTLYDGFMFLLYMSILNNGYIDFTEKKYIKRGKSTIVTAIDMQALNVYIA